MSLATDREDAAILAALGGESGWASVGFDERQTSFAAVGGRGRRRRMKRRRRRAARKGFDSIKAMRRARRKKIRKGLKKVANNKVVRALSKAVLSVVPGGQAVVGISTAARLGAKAVKKVKNAARRGDGRAKAALALGRAAERGDRAALATLAEASSGRRRSIPVPPALRGFLGAEGSEEVFIVRSPSGREYRIARGTL